MSFEYNNIYNITKSLNSISYLCPFDFIVVNRLTKLRTFKGI